MNGDRPVVPVIDLHRSTLSLSRHWVVPECSAKTTLVAILLAINRRSARSTIAFVKKSQHFSRDKRGTNTRQRVHPLGKDIRAREIRSRHQFGDAVLDRAIPVFRLRISRSMPGARTVIRL
jgi:hypothetical protein